MRNTERYCFFDDHFLRVRTHCHGTDWYLRIFLLCCALVVGVMGIEVWAALDAGRL